MGDASGVQRWLRRRTRCSSLYGGTAAYHWDFTKGLCAVFRTFAVVARNASGVNESKKRLRTSRLVQSNFRRLTKLARKKRRRRGEEIIKCALLRTLHLLFSRLSLPSMSGGRFESERRGEEQIVCQVATKRPLREIRKGRRRES